MEVENVINPEFRDYITSIVNPYRTSYRYFHVLGDIIIASCEMGVFYMEIGPIYNPDNFSFGFTIETIDKVSYPEPTDIASIICLKKYKNVHHLYATELLREENYIMDDETFSEINANGSKIRSRLWKMDEVQGEDRIVTCINGSYIKTNKGDTVTLRIWQNQKMRSPANLILFEYILVKKKTKLSYHMYTLQKNLG